MAQSIDCTATLRVRAGRRVWFVLMFLVLAGIDADPVQARQEAAATPQVIEDGSRLFPADTTVFLQINDLGAMIQRIWDHPLREKIEALKPVQKALVSTEFLQARIGIALLESKLKSDWMTALKSLTGRGIFIGADLRTQSLGVAIHARDETLLKKSVTEVLQFIKGQSNQGANPFSVSRYANGKIAKFDKDQAVGRFGPWLLISNRHEYLLEMADRLSPAVGRTGSTQTLADSEPFRAARAGVAQSADAWIYANLNPMRDAGLAPLLFRGMTEEPGVELLFGGILEALKDADWVAAELKFDSRRIEFNARLPFDAQQSPAQREFFFGTRGQGRAPAKLDLPDTILQATIYRDLGNWWLNKEDLFPENVVAQLAQGDSQLSTIFGGVDFGSDILGSLQPGMRLIIKGQEYAEGIHPDTRLPSFALIARMQNPEQARRFRISFQSLIGLLNLSDDGMDRPQIEVLSTREDGVQMTTGSYAPEGGYAGNLLVFNFSPSLAFQDDYMIVSSTNQLARELALKTKELMESSDRSDSNALISVNLPQLAQILRLNRQAMVASQMLEQGLKRAAAEEQVDLILALLEYGKSAQLDFRVEPQALWLQLELTLD